MSFFNLLDPEPKFPVNKYLFTAVSLEDVRMKKNLHIGKYFLRYYSFTWQYMAGAGAGAENISFRPRNTDLQPGLKHYFFLSEIIKCANRF